MLSKKQTENSEKTVSYSCRLPVACFRLKEHFQYSENKPVTGNRQPVTNP